MKNLLALIVLAFCASCASTFEHTHLVSADVEALQSEVRDIEAAMIELRDSTAVAIDAATETATEALDAANACNERVDRVFEELQAK